MTPGRPRATIAAASFSSSGRFHTPTGSARLVQLDDKGFILTDTGVTDTLGYQPLAYETSQPGIFAAGDARAGSMKRVAAAVGEGSSAIRSIHQHLAP